MKRIILTSILVCLTLGVRVAFASPATDYRFVRQFGEEGIKTTEFHTIDGVAVDRFGHVFVTDTQIVIDPKTPWTNCHSAVKRWSTDGQYELYWLVNEPYLKAIARGVDCHCAGDPFYIAPSYRSPETVLDIEHSTPVGAFIESFPGMPFHKFVNYEFRDVAVSADGFVYGVLHGAFSPDVTNFNMGVVVKFEWNGTNWLEVASVYLGTKDGMSDYPWGIDVDPWRDRVYVTVLSISNAPAGVRVYDMELNAVTNFKLWAYDAQPLGVAVDNRDGAFFVCEAVSNIICKYDTSANKVTSWGGAGAEPSKFNRPTDLDVDMDGYVYVADADNHRVQVFAPPMEGNLNFIIYKSKVKVGWKKKLKGKDRDMIMAKGMAAIDVFTNITTLAGVPFSFWYDEVLIISNMTPTKVNKKGTRALYKPDKNRKAKLVYRPDGALIKLKVKLKRGDVNEALGIVDSAAQPPWLWIRAQMTLSDEYLGVHYMRLEHRNKTGKKYKAWKK